MEAFKEGRTLNIRYAWPLVKKAKDLFAKEATIQASLVLGSAFAGAVVGEAVMSLLLLLHLLLWYYSNDASAGGSTVQVTWAASGVTLALNVHRHHPPLGISSNPICFPQRPQRQGFRNQSIYHKKKRLKCHSFQLGNSCGRSLSQYIGPDKSAQAGGKSKGSGVHKGYDSSKYCGHFPVYAHLKPPQQHMALLLARLFLKRDLELAGYLAAEKSGSIAGWVCIRTRIAPIIN